MLHHIVVVSLTRLLFLRFILLLVLVRALRGCCSPCSRLAVMLNSPLIRATQGQGPTRLNVATSAWLLLSLLLCCSTTPVGAHQASRSSLLLLIRRRW